MGELHEQVQLRLIAAQRRRVQLRLRAQLIETLRLPAAHLKEQVGGTTPHAGDGPPHIPTSPVRVA